VRVEILLKELRQEKGISLQELANITGISKSHLNYIEKNQKEPSLLMAVRIAQALDVEIDKLYRVIS